MIQDRIQIGLLGSTGRMGSLITQLMGKEFNSAAVLSATARRGDPLTRLLQSQVIIDVSSPVVMSELAELVLNQSRPDAVLPKFIVGSTGWTEKGMKSLKLLAKKTPVLLSSNFSVGVFALSQILEVYSPLFKKLGYTPVLVEKHHRHKKDAPSGTALTLRNAIEPEHPSAVQTHSIRAGEVIGDHEVTFFSAGDRVVLGHFAQDRSIFARGAIETAIWLEKSNVMPGRLLGMEDYFNALNTIQ